MDSILDTIKKMVGVEPSENAFDTDIVMHINTVLFVLTQLGVGPTTGFSITGKDETWTQFLGAEGDLAAAKSYIALRVKVLFDPPDRAAVLEAYNKSIAEFETRLNIRAEELAAEAAT